MRVPVVIGARVAIRARIAMPGVALAFVIAGGCERAGTGSRSDNGSNEIAPSPGDASITSLLGDASITPSPGDASIADGPADASIDAPLDARIVIITKSDLPIWTEIDGPKVTVPRNGTRSLAGVRFTFADFGSGTGPNGSLAMIGLTAAKGGAKEELNLSSRGRDPEFVVFDRGFVITSIGGTEIEITSVPRTKIDCTERIPALVDKLGIREPPKPDEIQGFTISGDGIVTQSHSGFTIDCGSITGRVQVTVPSWAKVTP